ncbi:hypothetical protein LGM58_08430 [Burkholderia contaminans]|uniref:hypothetical protein n=1 Tax=Burkholderia contaminans TaxID=488447 RepID=UPI001CF5E2E5|nr:hypothetical protein [Burkholderia contaminans]MCA7883211.1 hypothetical protein [Burkholderia contaminans]
MNKTSAEIRKIADDIEQVLREHDLATPDSSAIGALQLHASRLRAHCNYCGEKAGKITTLASMFYSARKHQSHREGSDGVWSDMHTNLELIRSWAEVWEEKGN